MKTGGWSEGEDEEGEERMESSEERIIEEGDGFRGGQGNRDEREEEERERGRKEGSRKRRRREGNRGSKI